LTLGGLYGKNSVAQQIDIAVDGFRVAVALGIQRGSYA
jgi:hypothetical protein